ncbi:hypothetical protein LTR85_001896 [Meristemomyces frigidus]|nr:hypothetical protein LTR85_001896 [Meristemomyces frigidus]
MSGEMGVVKENGRKTTIVPGAEVGEARRMRPVVAKAAHLKKDGDSALSPLAGDVKSQRADNSSTGLAADQDAVAKATVGGHWTSEAALNSQKNRQTRRRRDAPTDQSRGYAKATNAKATTETVFPIFDPTNAAIEELMPIRLTDQRPDSNSLAAEMWHSSLFNFAYEYFRAMYAAEAAATDIRHAYIAAPQLRTLNSGSERKLAVCDHCRAHALPCNEGPVCEQCILHKVACIHHTCTLSPKSDADCPRKDCRYVHEDRKPDDVRSGEALWVVLPGRVSEYLSRGRVYRMRWSDLSEEEIDERLERYVERQQEALDTMSELVRLGEENWKTVADRSVCRCAVVHE